MRSALKAYEDSVHFTYIFLINLTFVNVIYNYLEMILNLPETNWRFSNIIYPGLCVLHPIRIWFYLFQTCKILDKIY